MSETQLVAGLHRIRRLLPVLRDVADHYPGAARLGQSWSRVSELLAELDALAVSYLSATTGGESPRRLSQLAVRVAPLAAAAAAVEEHPVGSNRWWRAVHTLQRATDAACWHLPERNATAGSANLGNAPGVGPPIASE